MTTPQQRRLMGLAALLLLTIAVLTTSAVAAAAATSPFRPPAVPLFTFTPTTSVWCADDQFPNCTSMQHWSGSPLTWTMLVRVDQKSTYSLMGMPLSNKTSVQLATQVSLAVQPLQTIVVFQAGGVNVSVLFSQSSVPDNLEWYSRPVVYVTFEVVPNDGNTHDVQVYLEQGVDFVVNDLNSNVVWTDVSSSFSALPSARALRMNSYRQIAFDLVGDGVHNDWGFSYLVGATTSATTKITSTQASSADSRTAFAAGAPLPAWDSRQPRQANDDLASSILVYDLGSVAPGSAASEFAMFAYDEVESMFFFHEVDVPLWRHTYNNSAVALLTQAYGDYAAVLSFAYAFDADLMARLQTAGGLEYMLTCALVFRQVTGATVATWNTRRNMAWAYMKEMSSDGDVSTVDVLYPAAPLFLMQSPELLRLMLLPVLEYGNNATDISYGFNWAPHHLGTWPIADITQFQQENMPMEESANLLMMLAAIAMRQNGNVDYLKPYWPLLETWALYLNSTLPDPPNQLCTDDFEGPSPHNANLALKGIIGLAAYSQLRGYAGDSNDEKYYLSQAQTFIADWMQLANDGDHYRLQYNLPNTFSIKYNLAWHTLLGLSVVPTSVGTMEAAYYQTQRQAYGPPLDSRSDLALTVWLSMAGCFSTAEQAANVHHDLYEYVVSTPNRIPLSDVYHVASAEVIMFRARSVQGGFYAYALCTEQAEWKVRQQQQQQQSKAWAFETL